MPGIIGPKGTDKSTAAQQILGRTPHHLIAGRSSAFARYNPVRDRPDHTIVFDDNRRLFRDDAAIVLDRQCTESSPVRLVEWQTTALPADKREFLCTANVPNILNGLPRATGHEDIDGVVDRVDAMNFTPTKAEVIGKMRTFADDLSDVDLIEALPETLTIRTLINFRAWKRIELDPVRALLDECGISGAVQHIMDIMENSDHAGRMVQTLPGESAKYYQTAKRE